MTTTTDSDFLNWIADRLVHVHGESENVDYIRRLRTLATASQGSCVGFRGSGVSPAASTSNAKGRNTRNELPGQTTVYDFQEPYPTDTPVDPRD